MATALRVGAMVTAMAGLPGCAAASQGAPAAEGCQSEPPKAWPLWQAYRARFVQEDGRVVDLTGGGHSTSEGQSYAMFHALVADDRATFDRALSWADQNLSGGDLAAHLPAWKWGRREDETWGIIDENSASDADLWIAYSLLEAARLWEEPSYRTLGLAVAAQVVAKEVAAVAGLGPSLLPGPVGFQLEDGTTRLNPSYLPIQQLRGLQSAGAPGPWDELVDGAVRLLTSASHHGLVADWVAVSPKGAVKVDPVSGPIGSYDAIRVYLWAGMLHDDDDAKATLGTNLDGMVSLWRKEDRVPEKVDARLGIAFPGDGNIGFLAAILPEVVTLGRPREIAQLRASIEGQRLPGGLYGATPAYYEHNLLLFSLGFAEGRYRFDPKGRLVTSWNSPCEEGAR